MESEREAASVNNGETSFQAVDGSVHKIVIHEQGGMIVHALDEKARSYYNLESLWTIEMQPRAPNQEDLGKALAKVRRKRNNA